MNTLRVLALSLCGLAVLSAPASAELPPTPSDGIQSPHSSISAQDDALALESNPAGLAFMDRVELGYGYELPTDDYSEVANRSHALLFAWGNRTIGFGLGWQSLEQPSGGALLDRYDKYTLGFAVSPTNSLAIGLNSNLFGSRTSQALDEAVAWDVGVQWRLGEHFALGWVGRDLNQPFVVGDEGLRARSSLGLHFRLWEGRLQLDLESTMVRGLTTYEHRAKALLEPLSGLRLFGTLEASHDTGEAQEFDLNTVWTGLELSLGALGVAVAPVFSLQDEAFTSTRAYHWISPDKQRSLFEMPSRWITLSFNRNFSEASSGGFFMPTAPPFLGLLRDLDRVSRDAEVDGVVLLGGNSVLGYAQSWELRQAIHRLKQAGKKVVVYLAQAQLRDYYVASAADQIWLYPTESFDPSDLQLRLVSYRSVLEKLKIEAEFIRIGAYKSAPEGFVYDSPSEEAKAQTTQVLEVIHEDVTSSIQRERRLTSATWGELLNKRPIFPTEAKEAGLVDAVLYPDELESQLRAAFGEIRIEPGYRTSKTRDEAWRISQKIAVITVEGNIIDGRTTQGPFSTELVSGGETFAQICESLANDDSYKAVVVRIDSPGGSAIASDQMYRALRKLATKKPVVASMGNTAASGGYYAAAGADEIFASPLTITGSIGIFTGKFSANALLEWLGVSSTPITMGEVTSSLWEPWTERERERVEAGITYRYQLFLNQIATTRMQSAAQIDKAARGRVWSGKHALDERLVDQSGGLLDALKRAEELAGYTPNELAVEQIEMSEESGFAFGVTELLNIQQPEVTGASILRKLVGKDGLSHVLPLFYESESALMLPEFVLQLD